jgi:hypothetical protein
VQVAVLPLQSVAVNVRVIVPPHVPPTSGPSLQVTVGFGSQVSVAVAALGLHGDTSSGHCTLNGPGHTMLGAVTSCTTMVWLHEAALRQASVAVQVRVML